MSKEKYGFSKEVEKKAYQKAESFNPTEKKNIHHIVPKALAKKYGLPADVITGEDNAIALEKDTFHAAIHEVYEEADFIYLAVALLGLPESDFNDERIIHKSGNHTKRKTKTRRRNR